MVEQEFSKLQVAGSIPVSRSLIPKMGSSTIGGALNWVAWFFRF